MGSFPMSATNNFCDQPLPKYLDSKTVLIYCPHPVHKSYQKHECRNWDWGRAVSFLGIFVLNFGILYLQRAMVLGFSNSFSRKRTKGRGRDFWSSSYLGPFFPCPVNWESNNGSPFLLSLSFYSLYGRESGTYSPVLASSGESGRWLDSKKSCFLPFHCSVRWSHYTEYDICRDYFAF